MFEASKTKMKMPPCRITTARQQWYDFSINASPERACKRLQEMLKRAGKGFEPENAELLMSVWNDPHEVSERFIVEGGGLPFDASLRTYHVWDSEKIITERMPPQLLRLLYGHHG